MFYAIEILIFCPRKIFFLFQCWSLLLVPFVVDASARGRGKLSLLVEKWFLGNPSKSGIQRRCSAVHPESITLVTDGFYTIRYPTFLQRNLSPSFGLALNDLLRPLSLSNICIDNFPIMVNFCKCRFLGNSFHNYKMVIFFEYTTIMCLKEVLEHLPEIKLLAFNIFLSSMHV